MSVAGVDSRLRARSGAALDVHRTSIHSRAASTPSNKKAAEPLVQLLFGAGGGGRTRTLSPGLDFESSTSANSITPA